MELRVAGNSLHWSQPSVPHSRSLASAISSPSSKRRRCSAGDGALICRYSDHSALFLSVPQPSNLPRSRSCGIRPFIRKALSSNLDSSSDEEFDQRIQELASRFQPIDVEDVTGSKPEESQFERDEIISSNIEFKANSVEIPLSLRIIKRKKQWQEGLKEAGESACCSVKRAFSSLVFIIRELHSYTLQMREALFYEDLNEIIDRVQKDTHASFVWLFQKVFSHTPTLMVYVMILLANYSVHSLSCNAAIAPMAAAATEEVVVMEQKSYPSIVKTLNSNPSNGKMASVGGNIGNGGGKYRPAANGTTDGDGRFDESSYSPTLSPDDISVVGPSKEEDLDQDTMKVFISPVDARIEADECLENLRTEREYQTQLACDPNNSLLLANYAQFLYLVIKDYDRAEEYFKKAIKEEPKDAEALSKYANFLWHARDDLWAAEETYLEAISIEPNNSHYAGTYAHFLWNTGGEETCFPLSSLDDGDNI